MDPRTILEATTILDRNMETAERLVTQSLLLEQPTNLILSNICKTIYDTNSVIRAIMDEMIEERMGGNNQ